MATNIYAAFAMSGQSLEGDMAQYSTMLYRTALRKVHNHADAEDAVQDAWLSACKHIDQFQGRAKFSTWLMKIVVNAVHAQLRRNGRRSMFSLDQETADGEIGLRDQLMRDEPSPEDIYKKIELSEILNAYLKKLSPILREAVQLVDLDGQSVRDVASTHNIQIPTLKSRLSRGRAKLAKVLRTMPRKRSRSDPSGSQPPK